MTGAAMATEPDPALSPLQVGVILDRSSSTVRRTSGSPPSVARVLRDRAGRFAWGQTSMGIAEGEVASRALSVREGSVILKLILRCSARHARGPKLKCFQSPPGVLDNASDGSIPGQGGILVEDKPDLFDEV